MSALDKKQAAAYQTVSERICSGMKIGLGSGTTVSWAIKRIADELQQGKLGDIHVVATSLDTELLCQELGLSVYSMNDAVMNGRLDLCIDGADEVADDGSLIKGGGAAHTREKIVAYSAELFVCMVDQSKIVSQIGGRTPVPLEVLLDALQSVRNYLQSMQVESSIRPAGGKLGPIISDNGHVIIDAHFPKIADPRKLEQELNNIPGVVGHGIFADHPPMYVYIGEEDGNVRVRTPA